MWQNNALKTYLLHKIDLIPDTDAAQLAILCTWLVDVYLRLISTAEGSAATARITAEFREFLNDKRRHLNPPTTHSLIAAQGRDEEAVYFASVCGDWERVIS